MATRIQVRRGVTANVNATTPLVGELLLDTTTKKLRVGDGSTAGGIGVSTFKEQSHDGNIEYLTGNVLLATSTATPDERLHVVGNIKIVGQAYAAQVTQTPTGTTQTHNWNDSNSQVLDLSSATGNVTLTFTNPKSGASYLLKVLQGATTRTVVWPGSVVWLGNEPTLTTVANGFNVITFYYDGTNFIGTGDANIDGGGF